VWEAVSSFVSALRDQRRQRPARDSQVVIVSCRGSGSNGLYGDPDGGRHYMFAHIVVARAGVTIRVPKP
jgi:hypothetical protein